MKNTIITINSDLAAPLVMMVVFRARVPLVVHLSLGKDCPRGNLHGLLHSSLLCFFLHSPKHQSCEDRKMNYAGVQYPRSLSAWFSWSYNTDGFCRSKGVVLSFKRASATDFSLFRQKKVLKTHKLPEAMP